MDNNELLMIVLAFILGYMASGMMKQMCGGRLVEGTIPGKCRMTKDAEIYFNDYNIDDSINSIPLWQKRCREKDHFDCMHAGIMGPAAVQLCEWRYV